MKNVICINNAHLKEFLTIGTIYKLISEDEIYYTIIDNSGKKEEFFKERFLILNLYINENKQHLQFIYDRLINIHNENENVDYMRKFKQIIYEMIWESDEK